MFRNISFLLAAFAAFFVSQPSYAQTCGSAGTPGTGLCPMADNGLPAKLGSLPIMPANATSTVTLANFANRLYYVDDFGAVGNVISAGLASATDDTTAINNALAQASTNGGGTVCLNPTKAYKASSANITVPKKVTLSNCGGLPQTAPYVNQGGVNDFTAVPGALYLSTSYTINNSGWINGLAVFASNLTGISTYRQAATLVSNFAGTGLTCAAQECRFDNILVGGFNQCVSAYGFQRMKLNYILGDCTNGLYLGNSGDTPNASILEFWPFLTANFPGTFYTLNVSGAADNGSGAWRITTSATNSLVTGDAVTVAGAGGALGANQRCTSITVIDTTHFDCTGISDAPTPTGNTTNGSTYISGLSSTSGLVAGESITGTGIPGSTTITAVLPWSSAIYISNAATATNAGTTLTVSSGSYTSGGTVKTDTGLRSGVGIAFDSPSNNSVISIRCFGCYAVAYHTGFLFKNYAADVHLFGAVADANQDDPTSVGLRIQDNAANNEWIGGYIASYATAIVDTATSVSGSSFLLQGLSSGNGGGAGNGTYNVLIAADGDVVNIENFHTWSGAYIEFGPNLANASFRNSGLQNSYTLYASSAVQALVQMSGDIGTHLTMPTYTEYMGALQLGSNGSALNTPLIISGTSSLDSSQGAQIQLTNVNGTNGTKKIRVDASGNFQVTNSAYTADILSITDNGQAKFTGPVAIDGTAPTSCSATGTGGGATCAFESSSSSGNGVVKITAGTAPSASGTFTVNFALIIPGSANPACSFSYDDSSTAWASGALPPHSTARSTSAVTATWNNAGTSLTNTNIYNISYTCFGK